MRRTVIVCLLGLFLLAGCATLNQPLLKSVTALDIFKTMQDRADSSAVKIGNLTKENAYLNNELTKTQQVIGKTQEILNAVQWNKEAKNAWRSIGYYIDEPKPVKPDTSKAK